jgi:hypothetical protein
MNQNEESTQETLNEDAYEEEWVVKLNTKGEYILSKNQALLVQEAIASGSRGIVMFKTFSISVPYIAEFYRTKRFLKKDHQLTGQQQEEAWTEEDRLNAVKRIQEIKDKMKR